MRKIILTILLISLSSLVTFADETKKTKAFSKKVSYDLYQERVTNFCKEYKYTDNSSEIIFVVNEDLTFENIDDSSIELGKDLETAKQQYRDIMDAIYECAVSTNYKKSLQLIKDELISKNAKINSRLRSRIDQKIKKMEQEQKKREAKFKKIGTCKLNSNNNNPLIKKSILRQATYEFCRYRYYLEYLKDHNEKLGSLFQKENKISRKEFTKRYNEKQTGIDNEIQNIEKSFGPTFVAYSDYENNIASHIMLQLLLEDYKILRESLHKTLTPINQVVYKAHNAMRK